MANELTKGSALSGWFERFAESRGLKAYADTSVPVNAETPYLTYTMVTGSILDVEIPITVQLWYKTDSEAIPNSDAEALRRYLVSNELIRCADGLIWMKPGEPWCQSRNYTESSRDKARVCNLVVEYLTN